MTESHAGARSIWGGPLDGGKLVRLIFVDDAGTSLHEPVSVVAGLSLHADTQFAPLASAIEKTFDQHVPPELREGFIFHATEVYSGGKKINRNTWMFEDRIKFIEAMLAIPKALNIPVSFGTCARTSKMPLSEKLQGKAGRMRAEQHHHVMAFLMFVSTADSYLRRETLPGEIGMLVCEQTEVGKYFPAIVAQLRRKKIVNTVDMIRLTAEERATGQITQQPVTYISRIVETISFAGKSQSVQLQVADACAFAIRAWLARHKDGERLMRALSGPNLLPIEDFDGPSNGKTIQWTPPRPYAVGG